MGWEPRHPWLCLYLKGYLGFYRVYIGLYRAYIKGYMFFWGLGFGVRF